MAERPRGRYRKSNLFISLLAAAVAVLSISPITLLWLWSPTLEVDYEEMVDRLSLAIPNDNETAIIHPRLRPIKNRAIMIVHVGKAGGSTFIRSFYPQHHEPGNILQRTPVLLPICHMHACSKTTMQKATSLLFVVRNPIDRLISAYKFSHPDNCVTFDTARRMNVTNDIWGCRVPRDARWFYRNCASTLEELANVPFSTGTAHDNNSSDCRQSIRDMVGGNRKNRLSRAQSTHAFFNYAHYKNVTIDRLYKNAPNIMTNNDTTNYASNVSSSSLIVIEPKEILVVRTEHLWEDASTLDQMMGGSGNFNTQQKDITHGSENYHTHTSLLSARGYERLCCMLGEEIDAFEGIVQRATNLNASEIMDTVREVERKCGILAYSSRRVWAKSCRDRLDAADLGHH